MTRRSCLCLEEPTEVRAVSTQVVTDVERLRPIQRDIKDVAEHGRDGSAENVAQMLRIGKSIGDEDANLVRRIFKRFKCRIDGILLAKDRGHQRHHGLDLRQERSFGAGSRFQGCLAGLAVGAKAVANICQASLDARCAFTERGRQRRICAGKSSGEVD